MNPSPDMDEVWSDFRADNLKTFGPEPRCAYCGERVYMALQGLTWGGIWTTDPEAEGPASEGLNDPATHCPDAPENPETPRLPHEHIVVPLRPGEWLGLER